MRYAKRFVQKLCRKAIKNVCTTVVQTKFREYRTKILKILHGSDVTSLFLYFLAD